MKEKKPKSTKEIEMNANLAIKLPRQLREKVTAKSRATGISVSFIVRKSLEQWVSEGQTEQAK